MNLCIELIDLTLQFKILDNPLAKLWVDRMSLREQYPLDDPCRFYGFDSQQEEESRALTQIQTTCAKINSWHCIIERTIDSVTDQDTLNYLHSIFERYHGLLDATPEHPIYGKFPQKIRKHLADLNIDVHRCESVARGNRPRFVCTWYGLPKTEVLSDDLLQYGTLNPKFGSVCLNYCEIGKTLEDLTQDSDNYISDEAFRPFNHYSADFNVRLHEETVAYCADKLVRMQQYHLRHLDFFAENDYPVFQDSRLLPLRFPVAQLVETMAQDQLLEEIKQRQTVTKVYLE